MEKQSKILNRIIQARRGYLLLGIIILICLAYSNSLYSPPVLDDQHSFIETESVNLDHLSLPTINKLASTEFGIKRLIPMITFAINNTFTPNNILFYHLFNIFIHICAMLALFLLLTALNNTQTMRGKPTYLPWTLIVIGVCSLWALSPLQTNAVTYIVQRMTSLAALFYLLAMAAYIRGRLTPSPSKKWLWFVFCAFAAAMAFMSKENSATLPFTLIMLESFFITPGCINRLLAKTTPTQWIISLFILSLLLPLTEPLFQRYAVGGYSIRAFTMAERLLTESRIVVWYMSMLILPLPARMNLDHDPVISTSIITPPSTILSIIFILALLFFTWRYRNKSPLVSFGIFFFFLNLVIESTIIPLELVFEHRLYLPSVGFFIALAALGDIMARRLSTKTDGGQSTEIVFLLIIILASASTMLTTLRNHTWIDRISIYLDCAVKSPQKGRTFSNLGLALGQQERYAKAFPVLKKAITLREKGNEAYITAATNLSVCYSRTTSTDAALSEAIGLYNNIPSDTNLSGLAKFTVNISKLFKEKGRNKDALRTMQFALLVRSNTALRTYMLNSIGELADQIYTTENQPQIVGLKKFNIPKNASLYYMAQALINANEFEQASKLMARQIADDADALQMKSLKDLISRTIELNRAVAKAGDINNNEIGHDIEAIKQLKLVDFIINRYRPLHFVARNILTKLENKYPLNPFVAQYYFALQMKHDRADIDPKRLRKTIAANPLFMPLRMLSIKLSKVPSQEISEINELLAIQPGTINRKNLLVREMLLQKNKIAHIISMH